MIDVELFNTPNPAAAENYLQDLNPNSLEILNECFAEPSLADIQAQDACQFERTGYFTRDKNNAPDGKIIFNRIVTLRDTWEKINK